MEYGMFTEAGNKAVAEIVIKARTLHEELGYPLEAAWNWACNELIGLSYDSSMEEAMDTEVRESVYNAIV